MTNMENLEAQLAERERQQKVYDQAIAKLNMRRAKNVRNGYAVMAAADSFGESAANGSMARAAKVAQMFCIAFAFVTPCLLFIAHAL